ncbi:MAG: ABC transporter ATP-binding protein [Acholeplasmatales bacterium]|nr:ABC transporter ATP-binding protein [Acholeplasmatales bacterium]
MLEIKNITKTYKKSNVKAIDDITLNIEDGDIYGFIGPNGAGKSTTIKCVVGIHKADSGIIKFNGKTIEEDPIGYKKDLAYLPDNPELYEHLTGIQYIDFVCNIYGVKEEKNELIHKYATMFGIEDKLGDFISTYSHGMKQKVAIISALCHKPKLFVLDEPFVGLDPKASHDLKECIKELVQTGTMVFFSSHVLEVVEKFCNKVAIIKDGRIVEAGTIEEVKGDSSLEDKFLELFE